MLRLKIINSDPMDGQKIVENANFGNWINEKKNLEDQYAAMYIDYIRAGVTGRVDSRNSIGTRLKNIPVKSIYRNSLPVTE